MRIEVVSGTGEAQTSLGAFDAALGAAGVGDYNLVTLSSVIPPGAEVVPRSSPSVDLGVGTVVAVVLADAISTEPGAELAAGLGWAMADEGGVFMEATAPSRRACESALTDRLADVRANRDWAWRGEDEFAVCTHTVEETGAAVVAAVYGEVPTDALAPDG